MQMFGLKPQAKIDAEIVKTGQGKDISLEVLPEYAADHMFVTVYEPAGGKERAQELMAGPVWKNLPAVAPEACLSAELQGILDDGQLESGEAARYFGQAAHRSELLKPD
jgi:ABC-type Fe3+-citrate transport system substrate-binding protein